MRTTKRSILCNHAPRVWRKVYRGRTYYFSRRGECSSPHDLPGYERALEKSFQTKARIDREADRGLAGKSDRTQVSQSPTVTEPPAGPPMAFLVTDYTLSSIEIPEVLAPSQGKCKVHFGKPCDGLVRRNWEPWWSGDWGLVRFREGRIVVASSLCELEGVFSQVSDPRKARGIRHPFSGIVSLVFLGLLGRITAMAVVVRWANVHWKELKEPLEFLDISRPVPRPSLEPWPFSA